MNLKTSVCQRYAWGWWEQIDRSLLHLCMAWNVYSCGNKDETASNLNKRSEISKLPFISNILYTESNDLYCGSKLCINPTELCVCRLSLYKLYPCVSFPASNLTPTRTVCYHAASQSELMVRRNSKPCNSWFDAGLTIVQKIPTSQTIIFLDNLLGFFLVYST